jgi:DNA helicase HerA-like ATPase
MRIVNPVDQSAVASAVESVGRDLLVELPALSRGQAIVSGAAVNATVLCRVRERLTQHGGASSNSAETWTGFFRPDKARRRQADEALFPGSDGSSEHDLATELFGDDRRPAD